jgi:hypothetical protein
MEDEWRMNGGVQGPLGCKPSTILCSKCPTDAVAWTERDCQLDMSRRGHRTYRDVQSSFYSVNKHLTTSGTGETSDSGRPTDAVAWTERDCRLDMSRRGHRTYRDVLSSFYSVNKAFNDIRNPSKHPTVVVTQAYRQRSLLSSPGSGSYQTVQTVPGSPVDLTPTAGFPHYPGLVILTAGRLPPGPFRVGLTIP